MDTVNILLLEANDCFALLEITLFCHLWDHLLTSACHWPKIQDHLVLAPSDGQKVSVLLSRPTAGG